jgi:hypothetical protein
MSAHTEATETSEGSEFWKNSKIIRTLSQILSEIIQENKMDSSYKQLIEKQKRSIFYAKKPPSISISSYIERILKYTHVEESTLTLALIYIDKVCETNDFVLTENNLHR